MLNKKKKIVKLILILIIIAAAVIVVLGILKTKKPSNEVQESQIQLQMVEKRDLSESISLTGTVSGEGKMNYASDADSTFLTVNAEVGDEVKKGDVLATLDKEAVQKQIKALEKTIANNQAIAKNQSDMNKEALADAKADQKEQLEDAREAIEEAKAAAEEAKKYLEELNTDENALPEEIAEAEEAAETAEELYEAACDAYDDIKKATDDAVKMAQNTIDMEKYSDSGDDSLNEQMEALKKQLEECEIICQEDGVVVSVSAYVNGHNTPGLPVFVVENNTTMIMTASVEETDILKLEEGMKAIVTAKALEDQEIGGEVIKVLKVAEGSSGMSGDMEGYYSGSSMSGFSVQIKLDKSPLISGMSAKARILLTDKQDVLCVPYDLIQYDENGDAFVLCAQDNGYGQYTAVKKGISVGQEIDYYTEVTGGELAEGDMLIMDLSVYEGMVFDGASSMMDVMPDMAADAVMY